MKYLVLLLMLVISGCASNKNAIDPMVFVLGDVDPHWVYQRSMNPVTGLWDGRTDYWDCRVPEGQRCTYVGTFRAAFAEDQVSQNYVNGFRSDVWCRDFEPYERDMPALINYDRHTTFNKKEKH